MVRTPATRMLGDRSNHSTCHYVIECLFIIILKQLINSLIAVLSTKQAVVFLGKCDQTAAKTMIVDRKYRRY